MAGQKESIFEGKTLDDAVRMGLTALGLPRAEVMITVMEEGSSGFLGLGARPYKVRMMPRPGGAPREPGERSERGERGERGRSERGGRGGRERGGRGRREGGEGGAPARGEPRREGRGGERERGRNGREVVAAGGPRREERAPAAREERAPATREDRGPATRPGGPSEAQDDAGGEGGRRRRRGRRGGRGRSGERPMPGGASVVALEPEDAVTEHAPEVVSEAPAQSPPPRERSGRDEGRGRRERGGRDEGRGRDDRGGRDERGPREASSEPALPAAELEALGVKATEDLLKAMGFDAKVTARADGADVNVTAQVSQGEQLLIGPKGEVRQALQHLLNLMVNRGGAMRHHLQFEINDFWQHRQDELEALARSMADEASSTGRELQTEYLNAQERRVIHVTLRDDTRVKTYSIGDGLIKKLGVAPADAAEETRPDE